MKRADPSIASLHPPRIAEWIFRLLFPDNDLFTTLGDLEEIYRSKAAESRPSRARAWYWGQLIKALPHRFFGFLVLDLPMIFLSIKIVLRSLRNNKFFSFLNSFALTLGLTCFFLIFFYTRYEFTYDTFHPDFERIYRVRLQNSAPDGQSSPSFPLAPALEANLPEIERAAQYCHAFGPIVRIGQNKFQTEGKFADESFLDIFHFPLLSGFDRPLSEPYTVVLTESSVLKFFGAEDPLGKTVSSIIRGENADLTVTGVISDPPRNTHFGFDLLISFPTSQTLPEFKELLEAVSYRLTATYVKLQKNTSAKICAEKIAGWLNGFSPETPSGEITCGLQPLPDVHLRPDNKDNSAARSLTLYLSLGILILVIAGINYVNLSTSRSTCRMKEIGVRKTIGARKLQLVKQFIGESCALTVFSFASSLICLWCILPVFNRLLDKDMGFDLLFQSSLWLEALGIVVFVGLAAGLYPALLLSSFKPALILKGGTFNTGRLYSSPARIRSILVVAQFTVSVILIGVMLFIHKQVRFIKSLDTGFERSDIIEAWVPQHAPEIREKLLTNPNITGATMASNVISLSGRDGSNDEFMDRVSAQAESGGPLDFRAHHVKCDHRFLDVFRIPLVSGRNFSSLLNENRSAVVNETFARQMGSGDPLLKKVHIDGENKDVFIVGIVKDFHFQTLHHIIRPLILTRTEDNFMTLYIRLHPGNRAETEAFIRRTIDEFSPDRILPVQSLNDRLFGVYKAEQNQGVLMLLFSSLAVLIACLGLFGLSAFAAERKTKEIGIRKVLGAENVRLFLMMSKEYLRLSIIANVFGLPLAFYFVERWLVNFAYHVPILPWTFLLVALFVLGVMLLTSGSQIYRAARLNPVDVLRQE